MASQKRPAGPRVQYQQQPQTAGTKPVEPEQLAPFFRGKTPKPGQPEPPECPACKRRMAVTLVTPVLFASELDDVTYKCDRCGGEIKRTIKRV